MARKEQPFATIEVRNSEALNRRLRAALGELSACVPGRTTNAPHQQQIFSNKWLSPSDLHQSETPAFRELADLIAHLANRYVERKGTERPLAIASMWGIISEPEMAGERHTHGHSISAVYYVDAGGSGEEGGGILQFFDGADQSVPSHAVVPKSGLLVIFPSGLPHAVTRYRSQRPRIIVSASMG